jgi:protein TonB
MNRLQKKCFVAAAGFHLLLALILIVGPAFLLSNSQSDNLPILDFVPVKTVDALVSGGGNPRAQPPQPLVQPAPQPPAPVAPPAVSQAAPSKESEPNPDKAEPAPTHKHTIVVSTTPMVRRQNTSADAAAADKRAQDQRRRAAVALAQAAAGIQSGLSPSTTIELKGPGGGGVPYANFLQAVKTIYTEAWLVPVGITDDSATATASITIARDGKVISASIIRFSGNSAVDQSVQATLDRVRYAVPLPDDAKEDQRTVTINFNLKAKLLG